MEREQVRAAQGKAAAQARAQQAGTAQREHAHYVRVMRVLKRVLGGPICRALGFCAPVCAPECGPMLVVANHNMDFDPILLSMAFEPYLYFVASEHVFRWGLLSRLLVWAFSPIARMKGTADAQSAVHILRRLRRGYNVCLFAEGDRSFNGVTGPILPATGKLARASRASLVTYRLEGGYLSTPRWAFTRRRGRISGELVHVYSPAQLAAMTDEQVNAAIAADLYEDAFARQQQRRQRFAGRRLAEGLEYALYLCPRCGRAGTLRGAGDRFCCDCGLSVRYDEYGFFSGEDAPFSTVRDWDAWQRGETKRLAAAARETPDAPVFSDPGQRLLRIDGKRHRAVPVDEGTLSLSLRELRVGGTAFPLERVTDLALCGRARMVFFSGGTQYEISAKPACCGYKYAVLLHEWKGTR